MGTPSVGSVLTYWLAHSSDFETNFGFPLERDFPKCWACEKPFESARHKDWGSPFQRAHIVPRSLGGSDDPSNIALLCPECHDLSPDTVFPERFMQWARFQNWFIRKFEKLHQAWLAFGISDEKQIRQINKAIHTQAFKEWCKNKVGLHGNQRHKSGTEISDSSKVVLVLEYIDEQGSAGRCSPDPTLALLGNRKRKNRFIHPGTLAHDRSTSAEAADAIRPEPPKPDPQQKFPGFD